MPFYVALAVYTQCTQSIYTIQLCHTCDNDMIAEGMHLRCIDHSPISQPLKCTDTAIKLCAQPLLRSETKHPTATPFTLLRSFPVARAHTRSVARSVPDGRAPQYVWYGFHQLLSPRHTIAMTRERNTPYQTETTLAAVTVVVITWRGPFNQWKGSC